MSNFKPAKLSRKNLLLDWINSIVQIHNLICECERPLQHTVEEIYHQEPKLDAKIPTPCPGSTTDHTTADVDIGDVDLAALFDENFGEDGAAATTG